MSSVLKAKRGETKFDILIKARMLCKYTLEITTNENVFDPRYKTVLTDNIDKLALDIYINLFEANNIDIRKTNPNLKQDYELRRLLVTKAIRNCYNLLALIQLAKPIFHLKSKRIEYWGQMVIDVRDMARKLRNSDKDRTANVL